MTNSVPTHTSPPIAAAPPAPTHATEEISPLAREGSGTGVIDIALSLVTDITALQMLCSQVNNRNHEAEVAYRQRQVDLRAEARSPRIFGVPLPFIGDRSKRVAAQSALHELPAPIQEKTPFDILGQEIEAIGLSLAGISQTIRIAAELLKDWSTYTPISRYRTADLIGQKMYRPKMRFKGMAECDSLTPEGVRFAQEINLAMNCIENLLAHFGKAAMLGFQDAEGAHTNGNGNGREVKTEAEYLGDAERALGQSCVHWQNALQILSAPQAN